MIALLSISTYCTHENTVFSSFLQWMLGKNNFSFSGMPAAVGVTGWARKNLPWESTVFFLSKASASPQPPSGKAKRLKDFLPEFLQPDVKVSALYHKHYHSEHCSLPITEEWEGVWESEYTYFVSTDSSFYRMTERKIVLGQTGEHVKIQKWQSFAFLFSPVECSFL